MHAHNLEFNALNYFYNFVLLEGFCISAIVLQEFLYQLKLADLLRVGPITTWDRKTVCTAVRLFLLHMYVGFVLLFFKYSKSPSALVQPFIQLLIHQEIFMVYMSAVVFPGITVKFTWGSHSFFWELCGRAGVCGCSRLMCKRP